MKKSKGKKNEERKQKKKTIKRQCNVPLFLCFKPLSLSLSLIFLLNLFHVLLCFFIPLHLFYCLTLVKTVTLILLDQG